MPLSSTGTPLGLLPPGLPFGETELHLAPGDTLVLFSDGVHRGAEHLSTRSSARRACSRSCARPRHEPAAVVIDRLLAAIDAFAGGAPQFDDITLLVARRLPSTDDGGYGSGAGLTSARRQALPSAGRRNG